MTLRLVYLPALGASIFSPPLFNQPLTYSASRSLSQPFLALCLFQPRSAVLSLIQPYAAFLGIILIQPGSALFTLILFNLAMIRHRGWSFFL